MVSKTLVKIASRVAAVIVGVALLAAAAGFVLLRGPPCLDAADGAAARLRAPWRRGCRWVTQENNTWSSHRGRFRCSFDFLMPPGTAIYPARAGRVVMVERHQPNRPGFFRANVVVVEHADQTRATYAHLIGPSIGVDVGDVVTSTSPIGQSGMSGRTIYPHLHFQVTTADGAPLPARFVGVPEGRPRFLERVCAEDSSE